MVLVVVGALERVRADRAAPPAMDLDNASVGADGDLDGPWFGR